MADHDRGVDIEDGQVIVEVGPAKLAGRDTTGKLRPDVAADPSARGRDLLQPTWRDLVQRAPHRRRGRDRAEHATALPDLAARERIHLINTQAERLVVGSPKGISPPGDPT